MGSMRGCRSPILSPLTGVRRRLVVPRHPPTAHSFLPGLWNTRQLLLTTLSSSLIIQFCRRIISFDIMPDLLRCDWWSDGDSNPGHPACKAGALPTELPPHHKAITLRGGGRTGTRTWDLHLIRMAL